MAEKISVEIGLEGGDTVVNQLTDIGKAGQKAFGEIQDAAERVDLSNTTAEFAGLGNAGVEAFNKIQQAARSATIFEGILQGVKQVEGSFERLGVAATRFGARLTRSLGPLGVVARTFGPVGIAVGVLGGAFVKASFDISGSIDKIVLAAAKLEVPVEKLDVLQKTFTKSGVSSDAASSALATYSQWLDKNSAFATDLTQSVQNFIARLERMPDSVERTRLALQRFGEGGLEIIRGLRTGSITSDNFAESLRRIKPVTEEQRLAADKQAEAINKLSNAWTRFTAEVAAPILTPVFDFLSQQIGALGRDIQLITGEFKEIWSALQAIDQFTFSTLMAAWDAITGAVSAAAAAISNFGSILSGITWDAIVNVGVTAWNALANSIKNAGQWLLKYLGLQSQVGGTPLPDSKPIGEGGIGSAAYGGLIGGRGTGTSDSNLAWVSRGEHIMPARAVRQPGVLAFLETLRRSGGNLTRVLDNMTHFALGGLVPRPAMAFAGGGSVGGMSNVTIQFPGVPPVGGLRASSAVVDELRRTAALAQVRSGGRKPSRYS